MIYLDTNILVRLITQDIPKQAEAALQAIEQSGAGECVVLDAALVEAAFILQYHGYAMPRQQTSAALLDILQDEHVTADSDAAQEALRMFGTHPKLDFVDCLLAVKAGKKRSRVLTFDKDLLAALG